MITDEKLPLIVRDMKTGDPIGDPVMCHPSRVDRVMSGMLRQMNPDFYIDDSAFDDAPNS